MMTLRKLYTQDQLPEYTGWEPTEFELHRIVKLCKECRLEELSDKELDYISGKLLPYKVKYGRHPQPIQKI